MNLRVPFVIISLALLSSGCATTGDPSKGGLVGWSEKKAQQRQQDLEGKATEANQGADAAVARTHSARLTLSEEEALLGSMQRRLDGLLAENVRLARKLTSLSKSSSARSVEHDGLLKELNTLSNNQDPEQYFLDLRNTEDKKIYLSRIESTNEKTAEAIRLLLMQN